MNLTPCKRVELALRSRPCDHVPFTMYKNYIPQSAAERLMRNRGLCIVERMNVYETHYPNVKITQEGFTENGKTLLRTVYETPAGTLSSLTEDAGFTIWNHKKLFKTPDDYKAMLFMIQDERYEPAYENFIKAQKLAGDDMIFRANLQLEPLQALISGFLMDMQDFCVQWMENRDEILKLYDALVANRRKIYPIVAQSPAGQTNYGGNVVPEVIGPETFEKYYIPNYNEAAEVMRRHNTLIGCHFDANCRLLSELIASTDLDYIEAFTPAPDTDMTLAEAQQTWPGKALWLNFPSSVHMDPPEKVKQATIDLLDELENVDGVIMGITEDMPNTWQQSCLAIIDGLDAHALKKPQLYTDTS